MPPLLVYMRLHLYSTKRIRLWLPIPLVLLWVPCALLIISLIKIYGVELAYEW